MRFQPGEDSSNVRGNPCVMGFLDQERDVGGRIRERAIRRVWAPHNRREHTALSVADACGHKSR
ncbi:hypothetical protein, partial [Microvirga aerophila]|uniref:hypothetical protein n=1 Tax=Microvirga aerophila TaxID=670291 RepID=UPI001AEF1FEF